MAAEVLTAASPLLSVPAVSASKKRPAACRASSSSSWIRDKIERASASSREDSSRWINVERGSPRKARSLCGSTVRGRASLSKNWTRDKLERSEAQFQQIEAKGRASLSKNWTRDKLEHSDAQIQQTEAKKARKEGYGLDAARRQEESLAARQHELDDLVAVAYYAGPAFNNSPDPSELAIPFFVKSPDPSELFRCLFLPLKNS
ncbi:hypothetical protein U9M48_007697 [Paspalum notatum var. saurae]|uniref:Uncharacterized protein n=1 Tax=Paspalum notatum var. saurae TaxID=547442 RepID=A0AAQ3SMW7_PASNO